MTKKTSYNKSALKFKRFNTKDGVAPTDLYEYEYRTSVIKNPAGDEVFKMENVCAKRLVSSCNGYFSSKVF